MSSGPSQRTGRPFAIGGRPPAGTAALLIVIGCGFLAFVFTGSGEYAYWTGLVLDRTFMQLELWRLVSSLVYSGEPNRVEVIQVLGSGVLIWLLGGLLERWWGTRRLVVFVVISAVLANLVAALAAQLWWPGTAVGGAGGAAAALVAAVAYLYDRSAVFFRVLGRNWPLKTRHFIYVGAAIIVLGGIVDGLEGLPLARYVGYLAGGAVGFLFVNEGWRPWVLYRRWQIRKATRHHNVLEFRGDRGKKKHGSGPDESDPHRWN